MYTIIAVGKLKEAHFKAACDEYIKRLGACGGMTVIELPEQRLPDKPSAAEINAALAKEAAAIRGKIPKGAFICAMCIEGKELSSEALADRLSQLKSGGNSNVVFLIGGSFGLDEGLKKEAGLRLSMSPMTFPHHLARVMLLEQVYRAEKIMEGSRYHK